MKLFYIPLRYYAFIIMAFAAMGGCKTPPHPGADDHPLSGNIPEKIAPFFYPPPQYKDQYGDFRSPLTFFNGDVVADADDWRARRNEILTKWHALMGNWPPLIRNQSFEFVDSLSREDIMQYTVRFHWTPGEKTEGYLLIPEGKGKRPAVITVYYEPETAIGSGVPQRDFAYQLAKRGFVTLSIGTKKASLDKTYSLYYPDIQDATVQPLSMLAYAAANSWYALSRLQQVDSAKIGIMGHSFGGKWAMFASCLFEKFACSVWSDSGIVFDESRDDINYWEPWYLGYHPKPWRERGMITPDNPAKGLYPRLVSEGYNLHELHALMSPRPFLVSGGSEDPPHRWTALNHTVVVNKLLGYKDRVAMTNRADHSPDETSNEQAYLFLEYFLKGR